MADPSESTGQGTAALLAGLSHALDLTEGHPRGHAERSCVIGLAIGERLGLPASTLHELVNAMLLKDAGCSSNAARVYQLFGGPEHGVKRAVWERDWRRLGPQLQYALAWAERDGSPVARIRRLGGLALAGRRASRELFQIRCARGAEIAGQLGFSPEVASAIYAMDEHWDGGGHPAGLAGEEIPLLARIIGVAQVMEIFWHLDGPDCARDVVLERSGRWFDPTVVAAAANLEPAHPVWRVLHDPGLTRERLAASPVAATDCTPHDVQRIAQAFALIIDGKSPFTFQHSDRVARYAVAVGRALGADAAFLQRLHVAALVHDLGKLTVPNSILDAPGRLDDAQWQVVRRHPAYTYEILERVPVLSALALDAASHHERMDGHGYHRGVSAADLTLTARILAVADVTDALAANRPYRAALPPDEVLTILRQGAGTQFCPSCVDACSVDLVAADAAEAA